VKVNYLLFYSGLGVISQMMVFFTCKNLLVILLQLYRLIVIYCEKDTGDEEDKIDIQRSQRDSSIGNETNLTNLSAENRNPAAQTPQIIQGSDSKKPSKRNSTNQNSVAKTPLNNKDGDSKRLSKKNSNKNQNKIKPAPPENKQTNNVRKSWESPQINDYMDHPNAVSKIG